MTAARATAWSRRLTAALVDGALALAPAVAAVAVSVSAPTDAPTDLVPAALAVGVLLAATAAFWNRAVRQGLTGRSVGKSAVGLVLLDERMGTPVGVRTAAVRDLLHAAYAVTCVGYLWQRGTARRRTVADMLLATAVLPG